MPVSVSTTRSSRRQALFALTTVGMMAAVLTGCGSDDTAETTDANTQAPSAPATTAASQPDSSNSQTHTAVGEYIPADEHGPAQNVPQPEAPEALAEHTEEGLAAAIDYFWVTMDYAKLMGDVTYLQRVASPDCTYCAEWVSTINSSFATDQWIAIDFTQNTVTDITLDDTTGTADIDVTFSPMHVYFVDGTFHTSASTDYTVTAPGQVTAQYVEPAEQWYITNVDLDDDAATIIE